MACVAGIDIGSAFSKAVVIAKSKIMSYHIMPSGGNYKLAAEEVAGAALAKAALDFKDVDYTVATGYGASSVFFSNEVVTDISCQSKGIFHLFPSARTVADIGDMFTRVFRVDDGGRPTAFLMSGKCAGGSARLLPVIAHVLQVDLEEIGPLSLRSQRRVDFDTGCAVFAESEAVSRVAEGDSSEDILAGVHRALAAQIQSLMERVGIEPDCAVAGGGARDIGLLNSMEEGLGCRLLVPEEPQIVAALGAALLAEGKADSIEVGH